MTQGNLFPAPPPRPWELARATDPQPSHDAAKAVEPQLPALYAETLAAVAAMPGSTASELEAAHGERGRHFGRRLPEMETRGLVVRGAARRCTVTNHSAATWTANNNPAARAAQEH